VPAPSARLRRSTYGAAALLAAAAAVSACGGGAKPALLSRYPCTLKAGRTVARQLGVAPRRLHETITTSNAGNPECIFRVRGGATISAEVWMTSVAYTYMERAIVEDGQNFASVREVQPPIHVDRLGFDASWFPDAQHLMTTDGDRLITVMVDWPAVPRARRITVATAVARQYLGRLDIRNVPH
jgi:hypothetical protein